MRRIVKRADTRDRYGRILAYSTERLADDGRGRVHVAAHESASWCPGCNRPVRDLGEFRGCCDYCRRRGTCVHCEARCQNCSRRLCGFCRRGFAGNTVITVCPTCQAQLHQRQAFQDRLTLQKVAFDRRTVVQREWTRVQALRLQAARMRAAAQLQAARIRMARQEAAMRELSRIKAMIGPQYHARWYSR